MKKPSLRPSERKPEKKPEKKPEGSAPRRRPGGSRKFFVPLVVLLLVLLGGGVFFGSYSKGSLPGTAELREVELAGDAGDLQKLQSAGIVPDSTLFRLWAKVTHLEAKAGVHWLPGNLAPAELAARLERRGQRQRVTFPEGWNRFDMGKRLETSGVCSKAAFLRATQDKALLGELRIDGESAEGYLFPATYELAADAEPAEVVRRLKTEFDRRLSAVEMQTGSGRLDLIHALSWGTKEIVTLASMIEKEAAVDEDRPLIASVFLNRLRDPAFTKKILQCDPTAAYGCVLAQEAHGPMPAGCAHFTGKITHEVNVDPTNAYSTYTHEGLPPGPIANPGTKSLTAVLSPASTRYLYFVAKGGGRHAFSETYEAHHAAVKGQNP
jgi:UPF0755 protein